MLSIELHDLLDVLKLCGPYIAAMVIALVLFIAAEIIAGKFPKGKKFMVRCQAGVALVLVLAVVVNMICYGPMSMMITLATGNGTITEDSLAEAEALGVEIAEEGITLLENDGMLPLSSGTKLNVFGWASVSPTYGGSGSGALSGVYENVSLLKGLESAGFELNTELSDFYSAYELTSDNRGSTYGSVNTGGVDSAKDWTIPEPPADTYSSELLENAKAFSDVAVIVIARPGSEGSDIPDHMGEVYYNNNSADYEEFEEDSHYLELSQSEKNMIELVCSNFENVVMIYNGSEAFELGFVEDYPQIRSLIHCPAAGQTGFYALGSIISGAVNPSGRTVDTFVADLTNTPTYNNFGDFYYTNMDEYAWEPETLGGGNENANPSFVNYVEGIYAGYKFYETAAEEGLIDYDKEVLYPFGYGLSYTSFEQTMGELECQDGEISFDVTVTNTGSAAGKDTVEIYYNPPYYNGGIEKASANLVAFEKTELLEPGESQTLTISFNEEDMASFDSYGEGCYVLEEGDYGISIRSDSHNVLEEKTYTVAEKTVYNGDSKRSSDGVAATVQFSDVEGDLTYLSRADGFANYEEVTKSPTSYEMSEKYQEIFTVNKNYDVAEDNDPAAEMPTTGNNQGIQLVEMRGLDYDDPAWDTFMDQLTVEEMRDLIAYGGYQTIEIPSVGKVATVDCDGPASINNNFTGIGSVGMPCVIMIACTWNQDIAYRYGEIMGRMAEEMGVSGWYAPAVNIHRSAFSGRNFEYYSEDGVLTGKMAAKAVIGAKEHGVYSYVKHFALNDQETNRKSMLCTWSTEQAMREIYLKPFELAVKEGGASGIMTGHNFVGASWSGVSNALMNTVLRDEWGFRGMTITDGFRVQGYKNADRQIRNGQDLCLIAYDVDMNLLKDTTSATAVSAMRTSAKNIMYTVVNSNAYSDDNLDTGMMGWQKAGIAMDVALAAVLVICEILIVKAYKKRLQEK